MPVTPGYPGVYIEEIPSGVRTITGVPTSITAFVGRTWKGALDEPILCASYADFERFLGGLWRLSSVSYAVQQFFVNGGHQAIVVRTAVRTGPSAAAAATIDLGGGNTLSAASPGTWGRNLVVAVDHLPRDKDKPLAQQDADLFNLTILDDPAKTMDSARKGGSGAREVFLNLSRLPSEPRYVMRVLEQQSALVRMTAVGAARPAAATVAAGATTGSDGTIVADAAAAAAEVQGDATAETGQLNAQGINCLRSFPTIGYVVWGARTLADADALASDWKYVPVRRLALHIEESLFCGTKWAVFEPNDEPLWAKICLSIGAFMHTLFRQGAFQGSTPREAYFVKCDGETTTQNDINLGVVNIFVGFAPLRPAEFVVIRIQQMTGRIEA
jgi:phage tail sheath protein FI